MAKKRNSRNRLSLEFEELAKALENGVKIADKRIAFSKQGGKM